MEPNREKIIVRTSIIGIIANVLLAAFKAFVGMMSNSVAVIMDAVNNLSDALSSVIHHFMEQCRQLNGSYGGEFIKVDLSGDLTDVRLISPEQLRKDYCKSIGEDETVSLYASHYEAIHKFWNEYKKESHAG